MDIPSIHITHRVVMVKHGIVLRQKTQKQILVKLTFLIED